MADPVQQGTFLTAIEAVADAWATADGKDRQFRAGKASGLDETGHYHGYMADAQTLIRMIEARGFSVVRTIDR